MIRQNQAHASSDDRIESFGPQNNAPLSRAGTRGEFLFEYIGEILLTHFAETQIRAKKEQFDCTLPRTKAIRLTESIRLRDRRTSARRKRAIRSPGTPASFSRSPTPVARSLPGLGRATSIQHWRGLPHTRDPLGLIGGASLRMPQRVAGKPSQQTKTARIPSVAGNAQWFGSANQHPIAPQTF